MMKIGKLVKQHIMQILSRCENVERRELDRLLDKQYSKKAFGISYPFCVKLEQIEPRASGRFWTEVYVVRGEHVRVTSQWFEANRLSFIKYLETKGIVSGAVSCKPEKDVRKIVSAPPPPSSGAECDHSVEPAAAPEESPAFKLGLMYYEGRGVAQNYAEAAKWYRMAAAQGNAMAQVFLGVMYSDGLGVLQNHAEAVSWYRMAAAQGKPWAQYELGCMYADGRGVAQDDAEAVKWYRLAAAQGNERAQYKLGVMHDKGQGVVQDYVAAMQWYRLAAAQGDAPAQFNLGLMYFEGRGAAQDYNEAVKWFRLAAAQGHARAQHKLDKTYGNGQGGPQDVVEAVKWYRLARHSLSS